MIYLLSMFSFAAFVLSGGLLFMYLVCTRDNTELQRKLKAAQAEAGWNAVVAQHWREDALSLRRQFDLYIDDSERWSIEAEEEE